MSPLLAVPNFSEGRDSDTLDAIERALGANVIDVHADPDHNRSVFTLAGAPGQLAPTVRNGATEAIKRIDINGHQGVHPRVGVLDVAPIVYLDDDAIGAACAEALVLADMLGDKLRVPVFLYGELGGGRTRAQLRSGGLDQLTRRMQTGELEPDFGPRSPHPTAGAALVAARPPLIAFNIELAAPATLEDAQRIAATIREGGPQGLPGVRAIGLWLAARNIAQVSTNIEDHRATPVAKVVEAVTRHTPVAHTELVGLAPKSAFDGLPDGLPIRNKRLIEEALN